MCPSLFETCLLKGIDCSQTLSYSKIVMIKRLLSNVPRPVMGVGVATLDVRIVGTYLLLLSCANTCNENSLRKYNRYRQMRQPTAQKLCLSSYYSASFLSPMPLYPDAQLLGTFNSKNDRYECVQFCTLRKAAMPKRQYRFYNFQMNIK